MAEMPNVVTDEIIASEWGNDIRDRTVQRYDDAATRAAENPTPAGGDLAYMQDTGDLLVFHGATWKALMPTGVVVPFAAGTPPPGWLLCQGQAVLRASFPALFAVIGTTFGPGDGSTTFQLPDLRQRFPIGVAPTGTADALGETGGAIDHAHAGLAHTHPAGSLYAVTTGSHDHPAATAAAGAHDHPTATSPAGSHAHSFSDTTTTAAGSAGAGPGSFTTGGGHAHSVSGTTGSGGSHSHAADTDSAGSHTHVTDTDAAGSHTHTTDGATAEGGSAATAPTNPPFIALHFIIKA